MSIEYIVLFYHGKKDIPKIVRGLQAENIRGRRYLVFTTAPGDSNDVLVKELNDMYPDFDSIEYDNKQFTAGNARLIGIKECDQQRLFDRFCRELTFVNRESFMMNKTVCVFIGNANPAEAYMVSYYQPSFGYSVYTNNPTESFMPRHPEPIMLNSSQFKMLEFMIDRDESVSVRTMMAEPVFDKMSKNQYNILKNDLLNYGLIEEGKPPERGPRFGTTYYVVTEKGRYEYFLNGGKKGLASDDLFTE